MATTGNYVQISTPEPSALLTDWTSIRLYSASTRTGSYSLLTTLTLVSGTTSYAYQDTAGTATTWYRWSYYNTGTVAESAQGEPFPGAGALVVTRQTLRRRVAMELGFFGHYAGDYTFPGPSGTTTSSGSSTTAVDSGFADAYWDVLSNTFARAFLYLNDGTYAGQERPIATLTTATGTFTVGRAFGGTVASGVTFDIYHHLPTERYNAALGGDAEGAFLDVWQWYQWPLAGSTPASGDPTQTEYALPYWVERPEQVLRVTKQTGSTVRAHALYPGQEFEIRENGYGVSLYFPSGIGQNTVMLVEGYRHPAPLASDSDTLVINELQLRLLVTTAAIRVLEYMFKSQAWINGTDTTLWKERLQYLEAKRKGLLKESGQWTQLPSPRREMMAALGSRRGW